MKPLNEWTDDEIVSAMKTISINGDSLMAGVRELLRRARVEERERCAAECDLASSELADQRACNGRSYLAAGMCAARIRGLT